MISLCLAVAVMGHSYAEPFPLPKDLPSQPQFPNPLVGLNGKTCSTVKEWNDVRKPELQALFQHYMYGPMPPKPASIDWKVTHRNRSALEGKAVVKEIALTAKFANGAIAPTIYVLLVTPIGEGPFPCFVGPNFGGNHLLLDDAELHIPEGWMYDKYPGVVKNKATAAGRGKQPETWPLKEIVARGFAVATFCNGDLQPDRANVAESFRALKIEGATEPFSTIAIWAWGVSRVADYLETQTNVDRKRLAVVGHSRLGKTALLAGAFDERFRVIIPNQAGCGGSGPSRHNDPKAEAVKRINTSFPHWFNARFKEFNDDPSKLPFDQNGLVALCAPRAVLFTNAEQDLWANPAGQFQVLKAAEPVYRLFGEEGCAASSMPPMNKLVSSRLGYFIRSGVHAMTPIDWAAYMDFADRWLAK